MAVTRRGWLAGTAAAGAALAAGSAAAQASGGPFVTKHRGTFGGQAVDYSATVGETVLSDSKTGQPTLRLVTTAYAKTGADPKTRPVLFAFNGGPSAASATLHMVAIGPKRIAIAEDPKAPAPPAGYADNPLCPLDACDIVFVDPAETGFSRILPGGSRATFYSVNGDAQSISDLVVAWCKANGREASPKYVLGESYGTMRAAVMAGQLSKVMPLDGVFIFGQAVNMIETSQRAKNALAYATNITALAAIAAYHGRSTTRLKDPAAIADAAYAWGMGEYLQALLKGHDLPPARRKPVAQKLQDMTGISGAYYLDHGLAITKIDFALELLKDQGLMMSPYDARYAGPAPKPGQRPVDPLDKVRSPIDPMLAKYMASELGVTWPMGDYRGSAPGANAWTWSGTLGPGGPFLDYDYQARVSEAFRANPKFRLVIGTGYYDLTTTIGPARYLVTQSDWPRERVSQRQYVGGHMAYTVAASHKAFTDDIRALVGTRRA
jgi:carboxypeptidase C (cathepsin A)